MVGGDGFPFVSHVIYTSKNFLIDFLYSGNGAAEIMPRCTALIHLLEYVTL